MNKQFAKLFLMLIMFVITVAATDIAVVAKIIGTVTFQPKSATEWKALKAGTLLSDNANIRTGADGFATILYIDDKSSVKMRPKSELIISGVATKGSIDKTVKMAFGETSYSVTKGNKQFRVETPTSVASVKGTEFIIIVSSETKNTSIFGISGEVSVSNKDGSGEPLSVTSKTKASVGNAGTVVLDTVSAEEFLNIESLIKSMDSGDTTVVTGHSISLKATQGGSVTPVGNRYAIDNISFDITAKADSGYEFTGWMVVSGKAELSSLTTLTTSVKLSGSDASVEAQFAKEVVKASVTVQGEGTANRSGSFNVEKNKIVAMVATPAVGYSFIRWESVGEGVAITNATSPETDVVFTAEGSVCAVFERIKSSLIVSGKATPTSYNGFYGDTVTLSTTEEVGFFTKWKITDGTAIFISNEFGLMCKIILTSENVSISADLVEDATYSPKISVEPNGNAVFQIEPSKLKKPFTIVCNANAGWEFSRWEIVAGKAEIENVESSTTSITIPEPTEVKLRAVLVEKADEKTLFSIEPNDKSTFEMPTSFKVDRAFTITCTPKYGFVFTKWEIVEGKCEIENTESALTKVLLVDKTPVKLRAVCNKTNSFTVDMMSTDGARKTVTIEYIEPQAK